jgi:hypothetical protein
MDDTHWLTNAQAPRGFESMIRTNPNSIPQYNKGFKHNCRKCCFGCWASSIAPDLLRDRPDKTVIFPVFSTNRRLLLKKSLRSYYEKGTIKVPDRFYKISNNFAASQLSLRRIVIARNEAIFGSDRRLLRSSQ